MFLVFNMRFSVCLLAMLLIVDFVHTQQHFSTLEQLSAYAQQHSEQADSNSLTKPTLWDRLKLNLGWSNDIWSPVLFEKLLDQHIQNYSDEQYLRDYALIIREQPGAQFVIFGPVVSAFHSLVRSLQELERQGILDNQLRIIKPHCYIVFDGNVIGNAPYTLETLTVVMMLMQQNPDKVWYLQGRHERNNYWYNSDLKAELKARIVSIMQDQTVIPLKDKVTQYFSTLPLALFLVLPDKKDIIRVSYFPRDHVEVNQSACTTLLKKDSAELVTVCPMPQRPRMEEVIVKTVIRGEDKRTSYVKFPGAVHTHGQRGESTWALFSGPNAYYKKNYEFDRDAFTIITLGKSRSTTTLALYIQDAKRQGFTKQLYNLASGQIITDSTQSLMQESKQPLILGCTLDLTKGLSGQGRQVKDGISLYLNAYNQAGGMHGRPVQIIFMDDQYSPEKARSNVEEFIRDFKSTLFLCPLGSPTLQGYLDLVKEDKIFVFFPGTGAPLFRKPDITNIVHWRASYENEAKVLTDYVMKKYQSKSFAFFFQDDSYGKGALEGARASLKRAGIETATEVPYARNTTQFKDAVAKLKNTPFESLGFFSTSLAAMEFIRQANVEFFIGKHLFALSDLAEEAFKRFIREKGLEPIIAQFAPNPRTSTLEIVKEYRTLIQSQGQVTPDVFNLEGYISASLAFDILSKAGDNPTHASILKVISNLKNYNFKGLLLNFNPKTRELIHKLWLDIGQLEWIEQSIKN